MRPWLKNASEAEKDSRTSRSRCSSDSGRRKFKNGSKNSPHSGSQMYSALARRPNAPGYPRAIVHAT